MDSIKELKKFLEYYVEDILPYELYCDLLDIVEEVEYDIEDYKDKAKAIGLK